jgi:hypothetical protein
MPPLPEAIILVLALLFLHGIRLHAPLLPAVSVPWSRRVLPFSPAPNWPGDKRGGRRHKASIDQERGRTWAGVGESGFIIALKEKNTIQPRTRRTRHLHLVTSLWVHRHPHRKRARLVRMSSKARPPEGRSELSPPGKKISPLPRSGPLSPGRSYTPGDPAHIRRSESLSEAAQGGGPGRRERGRGTVMISATGRRTLRGWTSLGASSIGTSRARRR